MTTAKLVPLFFLILLSCRSQEQIYENAYLKLQLPPGWVIADQNNEEESRWLVASINPLDLKNFDEGADKPTNQNLIVVATVHAGSTNGDFVSFCRGFHSREVDRMGSDNVSILNTFDLKKHPAYYWKSTIHKEGEGPLVQEKYLLLVDKFYLSFIFTYSPTGSVSDTQQILQSIAFK